MGELTCPSLAATLRRAGSVILPGQHNRADTLTLLPVHRCSLPPQNECGSFTLIPHLSAIMWIGRGGEDLPPLPSVAGELAGPEVLRVGDMTLPLTLVSTEEPTLLGRMQGNWL